MASLDIDYRKGYSAGYSAGRKCTTGKKCGKSCIKKTATCRGGLARKAPCARGRMHDTADGGTRCVAVGGLAWSKALRTGNLRGPCTKARNDGGRCVTKTKPKKKLASGYAAGGKKPTCAKGKRCGNTCISSGRECRGPGKAQCTFGRMHVTPSGKERCVAIGGAAWHKAYESKSLGARCTKTRNPATGRCVQKKSKYGGGGASYDFI